MFREQEAAQTLDEVFHEAKASGLLSIADEDFTPGLIEAASLCLGGQERPVATQVHKTRFGCQRLRPGCGSSEESSDSKDSPVISFSVMPCSDSLFEVPVLPPWMSHTSSGTRWRS